ncbi:MAG: hypothetical protein M3540_02250 [Actinomycetota bacterium]|nr:hypothetical protein [Actinomycetota bacterium]
MSRVALFPFVSGGVLAHLGACLSVGEALQARGHEVFVGVDEPQEQFVATAGLQSVRVAEIPHGRLRPDDIGVYRDGAEIVDCTRADIAVLEQLRPDAAVIDVRGSAALAAETLGIPHLSLIHQMAWSGAWRDPHPWRRRARWIRRPQRAGAFVRLMLDPDPLGVKAVRRAWAEARGLLGLAPASSLFETGNIACATTPTLDPMPALPERWRWVGPITWSAPGDPIERGGRPLVYVTQGSTGDASTLRRAVQELASAPVDILVSTGGLCSPDELNALAPNVSARRLVSGRAAMEAADVAVVHGGHFTTLEAHLAGTPVVVIPLGYDQFLWADRVERLGTGISLREPYLRGAIRRSALRLIRRGRYRRAAEGIAAELRQWDGPGATADFVEDLLRA